MAPVNVNVSDDDDAYVLACAVVTAIASAPDAVNADAFATARKEIISSTSPPAPPSAPTPASSSLSTPPSTPPPGEYHMITLADITLYFHKGYIADPYWPARARVINIQKESGMNRAKSEGNKNKALEEYLKRQSMTNDDYAALLKRASEPFYTDETGSIIIPEVQVYACFVNGCDQARAATRACAPEQVRSRFELSCWKTAKRVADGVWERFVTVTAGTGQKLSNQRGLRSSSYIQAFEATGRVSFDSTYVKPQVLRDFVVFVGDNIGIGASRKMGWGRFELRKFEVQ